MHSNDVIYTPMFMPCVTALQRLSQTVSVEYQESKLTTPTATLQAAQTGKQRREGPLQRTMATKVGGGVG